VTWAGESVQCMWCGLDSQYSNCVMDWTISTANVKCTVHSLQQLCFVLDSQYSMCVVVMTASTTTVL